jgi:hypothetical protein
MLEEIILNLKSMKISELKLMSESIDVSYDCLLSIRYGRIENPTIKTVLKIQKYFEQKK